MSAIHAGEIDMAFGSALELLSHVREGRARLRGVSLTERLSGFPDVPAIAELVPGYGAPSWFAMFAPKTLPQPLLDKVTAELGRLRDDPDVMARMARGEAVARLGGTERTPRD